MNKTTFNALRWGWTVLAGLVLLVTVLFYDGRPNSDAEILLAYGMLILAFPMSIAIAVIVGVVNWAIHALFGVVVTASYLTLILGWAVFFAAGYWQWFVLVPRLLRSIRNRRASSPSRAA